MKKQRLHMAGAALLLFLFTAASKPARLGALTGLRLLTELLIPSLLPFFVATGLLNRLGFTQAVGQRLSPLLGRVLGIRGCGCTVFLLGLSGGYPLGAASAAELCRTGQLSREETLHLLRFCDNTGPAFALGAVGAAFGSTRAGLFLWGIHVLSAMLTARFYSRRGHRAPSASGAPPAGASLADAFTGAVQNAVQALLSIAGYVVFFGALLGILDSVSLLSRTALLLSRLTGLEARWWQILFTGILELSSAAGQMQGLSCSRQNLALGAFLLSWGGLCIHFQAVAVLQGTGLNGKERLGGKLLQGVLAGVLAYFLSPVFF